MNQEEESLLLKDLSARLPYGVKCRVINDFKKYRRIVTIHPIKEFGVSVENNCENLSNSIDVKFEDVKPYLFPLSSMTEEQEKESNQIILNCILRKEYDSCEIFDYYNEHHFDYRGLIKKGLALDATNLNIY